MANTIFKLSEAPVASIQGSEDRFPVGRIFCVGRNYAVHARNLGKDPEREPPFFFTKFPDNLVPGGGQLPYPPATDDYHYEVELVLAIGVAGAAIAPEKALDHIFGYAVGLDMTRRDLQLNARDQGRPWDMGKNFSYSAPLGPIRPVTSAGHLNDGAIRLSVNGGYRQDGTLAEMIWGPADIIAHLSRFERLLPGDLIFTGTPAGVGAAQVGDRIEAEIDGLDSVIVEII